MHQFHRIGRPRVWAAAAVACMFLAGCEQSGIADRASLAKSKSLAVLPACGALDPYGCKADAMQAGVLLTALSRTPGVAAQGPARLRKAVAGQNVCDPAIQAHAAAELGIDTLVLCEVTDLGFTKSSGGVWFFIGSADTTTTTYHACVAVRMVAAEDGRLLYCARGQAKSSRGLAPAVLVATDSALAEFVRFKSSLNDKETAP